MGVLERVDGTVIMLPINGPHLATQPHSAGNFGGHRTKAKDSSVSAIADVAGSRDHRVCGLTAVPWDINLAPRNERPLQSGARLRTCGEADLPCISNSTRFWRNNEIVAAMAAKCHSPLSFSERKWSPHVKCDKTC